MHHPTASEIKQDRVPRLDVDTTRPAADSLLEVERYGNLQVTTTTAFLTGRECPLTCSMCDLWKFTINGPTPPGHIPMQIGAALAGLQPTDWIKLYNASNFFDPLAIPVDDYEAIAKLCEPYKRVVVENHPLFNNRHIGAFQALLTAKLEIAVGLESTNDRVLKCLNKQMTSEDARRTIAEWLAADIDCRAFVMIAPPCDENRVDAMQSTIDSVQDAFRWGVRHVSLIPTRADWGPLKQWVALGAYCPPTAEDVELAAVACMSLENDVQTCSVDVWNWNQVSGQCDGCREPRLNRLKTWSQNGLDTSIDLASLTCDCPRF